MFGKQSQHLAWSQWRNIVGNDVSVQITNAANSQAAFAMAEDYCRKNDRSARFVAQNGATAAFDCVKVK